MPRIALLLMTSGIWLLSSLLADASPSSSLREPIVLREPVYRITNPYFNPEWRRFHEKNGASFVVSLREEYARQHRWGWDRYLQERRLAFQPQTEQSDSSGVFSSDLDVPFVQGYGVMILAEFDGYEDCRRAFEKLETFKQH